MTTHRKTTLPLARARGFRGIWCAKVGIGEEEAEWMPCIHNHWRTGLDYHDPFIQRTTPQQSEFLSILGYGRRAVLTDDVVGVGADSFPTFARAGYLGVWRIGPVDLVRNLVTADRYHLRFRLVDKLASFKA